MKCVLVATEGEPSDRDALREALALLGDGHRYLFLAVYRALPAIAMSGADAVAPALPSQEIWDDANRTAHATARRKLQETIDVLGVKGDIRVEEGDPADLICATAVDEHADLIVVGDHHHSMLSRLLGGSTTDSVAHHSPCPVLLARRSGEP